MLFGAVGFHCKTKLLTLRLGVHGHDRGLGIKHKTFMFSQEAQPGTVF